MGYFKASFCDVFFDSIRLLRPDNSRFSEILQVVASKVIRSNSLFPAFSGPEECVGVGFGAMRAGGFLPVKAAGSCKTVASSYLRGRGACTQYDPKVMGAKTLDRKGDAYCGS